MDQATPGASATSNNIGAASHALQAFATEMQSMGKESMEQATQVLEQLRNAKSLEEVVSLQTTFMQQTFMRYTEFTRRMGGLMTSMRPG